MTVKTHSCFQRSGKLVKRRRGECFLGGKKEFESLTVVREGDTEKYILMAGSAKGKILSLTMLTWGEGQRQKLTKRKLDPLSWCCLDKFILLGNWELKMSACFPALLVLHSMPDFPPVFQGGQNLSVYFESTTVTDFLSHLGPWIQGVFYMGTSLAI